jgi:hypothetical protein
MEPGLDRFKQRDQALRCARAAAKEGNAALTRLMLHHARDFAAPTEKQVLTVGAILRASQAARAQRGETVRSWL